jgi:hypothetical protein
MSLAIPAYEIFEVLEMPKLKSVRDAFAAEWKAKMLPKAEVALAVPEADNPHGKEDFTSLLNAAATKKPPAS